MDRNLVEPTGPMSGCVIRATTEKAVSLTTRSGFEKGLQKVPGSSAKMPGLSASSASVTSAGTT